MKHPGTKTIETERLLLRRFAPSDAEAMYRNWASDREVTKFLTWQAHESVAATEEILAQWAAEYEKDDCYQWAIVLKSSGEPIGSISVVSQRDDLALVHIGYCIGRNWWGQGVTTEALGALIPFFFEEVGVNRIESRHDTRNPASGRVMQKCGMTYEGTLRQRDHSNQGVCDAAYYAILADEWAKIKAGH